MSNTLENTGLNAKEWAIIRTALKTCQGIERAVLFGSRAMGLARSNSDVDIMLYGQNLSFKDLAKIRDILEESTLPYRFDIILHDKDNTELDKHLKEYGKNIFMEWEKVKLVDCQISIIDGDRGKNYPNGNDFREKGFCLFLNTKNVPNTKFNFLECAFITKEKDTILRSGKLEYNDIIVTTRGTIGNFAYYKANIPYEHMRINSGMVILRNNDSRILTDFLYHLFFSPTIRSQIYELTTGAAQPQLPIRDFKNIEILLPPLAEQEKIASILSALDDKIEVNNKINKNLEEQAQALFKSWFVDFEPFGGTMPEDWKEGTLGEIAEDIICGKTPPTKEAKYYGLDVPFVTIPDMHTKTFLTKTERYLSLEGAEFQKNKYIPKDSICVSCIATAGLVSITAQASHTNQQINSIICKPHMLYYLYLKLKSLNEFINNLGSSGSATKNLNKEQFSKIKIVMPSKEELINYDTIVNPLFSQILKNQQENETVTALRDSLLPKLMKGEI